MPGLRDRLGEILAEPLPYLAGGELVGSGDLQPITSPTDVTQVGAYVVPGPDAVDASVAQARSAFETTWSAATGAQRADVLLAIRAILSEHAEELSGLDALEIGKPVTGSRYSDIPVSLEALAYFAGRAQDLRGTSVDVGDPTVSHRSRLEPYGVVLEVLPWNGPLWTGVQRLGAILASGNVAVIKPASWATASFSYLASLIKDVVPPGVVTVLPGPGGTVGRQLIGHPDVAMVSLTGGTDTGRQVLAQAADSVKRVSLELGGKNPNLVLADADLNRAVQWSLMGAFSNSGQICVCGSRILVHASIADEFVHRLAAASQQLVLGDPLDETTSTGPVVSRSQFDKIWGYIDQAIADGTGQLVIGGQRYTDGPLANGYFIPPTMFTEVPADCRMFTEEIFGPVVSVTRFDELDEAIALANGTQYGLASGVFTENVGHAEYVANRLQAGQVYVNQWFAPGVLQAPSQGYKASGIGGVGMEKYLQVKNIFVRS